MELQTKWICHNNLVFEDGNKVVYDNEHHIIACEICETEYYNYKLAF